MTWTAAEMPNSALPPDSLVGRMLRPSTEECSAVEEPLPLWRVMSQAWSARVIINRPDAEAIATAAEIEALRDWLLPEEPEPEPPDHRYEQQHIIWQHNNKLRALLTEQARIARSESQ